MLNHTAPPSTSRGLIRILGVGFGLAVIVGSTLGIGILRTPGLVAGQLPNRTAILAVWIAGGLYTLVGAACLAELGTMLPDAGGYYVYARRAFGDAVGFAVGWTDWITYCAVLGYVSIAIGEFAALLLPSLGGHERAVPILTLEALAGLQVAVPCGRGGADSARRPRPRDHHDSVDCVAAADAQCHPDDRDADSVRDGARRTPVAAGSLGDRAWNAGRRHAGDHSGGSCPHYHRHVSAAGGRCRGLPCRHLRRLLPCAPLPWPARAGSPA